ncbi:MAG: polysaccharide pyruvyl transferase CsaB [Defluviitaleaceae bacterium]|nr:polysaccharide pyruvyl transferase CsaB [Defluviitaleaceae bacterium]
MTHTKDATHPQKILMTLMGMEIGGAETHVLELSKTLQHMGLDVHVVSNGGVYVKELEECGIKHYRVPLHNKQFINVFSSYKAIRKIIVENNIRLVHAHARIPAFICGLLQRRLDFQLVTTVHGEFSVAFPFNRLSNWGDRVFAVSQDLKDYLLTHYKVDEEDISLTVNGIDTNKFSPNTDPEGLVEELGLWPDTKKIVSISRLDYPISLPAHALIKAAEDLAKDWPIEIVIVGDGDDFEAVKASAEEVNKNVGYKLIHITGQRTDVNRFLSIADIFVNAARASLEAMSAACPVILAGGAGYMGILSKENIDAAIKTNFTCRGYEEVTGPKLAADIVKLLAMTDAEKAALGVMGRETVKNLYSLERMANDSIEVYEDMLQTPARATRRRGRRRKNNSTNVVISGYYGYHNSGDDIILQSIVQNLRALREDLSITVLSNTPKETRAQFDVNAIHRFNFISVFKQLRKTGLLITGGGNLIQDETSTKSLIYYLLVINMARRLGAKNMIYAKGIGPVYRPINVNRVRRALNRIDLITLREPESLEALSQIGVTGPEVHVAADASFALPPVEYSKETLAKLGIKGPFFAVGLRTWQHNPPDLEEQVAVFADYIVETYGYQAVFVPMRLDQDSDISRRVMTLMKHPSILVEPAPQDFNQAQAIMGAASFALAMRLHALIYAMGKGVPCIGLVYSSKIRQFMESMGQSWHMPIEETKADKLIEYADAIHKDMESVSAEIYEASCKLRELSALNAKLCIELIERG